MTMDPRILTSVQSGLESSLGTLVPATIIFPNLTVANHRLVPNVLTPAEYRGDMALNHRSVVVGKRGEIHLEGYATFENLGYFFRAGFVGGVSGTTDGGTPSPAYTYSYDPAITAPDAPGGLSFEIGGTIQDYAYNGCFVTNLQLSGVRDDVVKVQADLTSKTRVAQTRTGSLSAPTTEDIIANNTVLSVDASGGTIGTTSYPGCLINWTWRAQLFQPFKCLDGTLFYTTVVEPSLQTTLELMATFDANLVSLLAGWEAQTRYLVRLQNTGSSIHGGTPSASKRLRLDGAYIIKDATAIGSQNEQGQQTVRLMLESQKDATASLVAQAELVTAQSSLT